MNSFLIKAIASVSALLVCAGVCFYKGVEYGKDYALKEQNKALAHSKIELDNAIAIISTLNTKLANKEVQTVTKIEYKDKIIKQYVKEYINDKQTNNKTAKDKDKTTGDVDIISSFATGLLYYATSSYKVTMPYGFSPSTSSKYGFIQTSFADFVNATSTDYTELYSCEAKNKALNDIIVTFNKQVVRLNSK